MRDSFVERLDRLAELDERVMLVTGDLGFGVLTNFAKKYPKQYINAGIAEQNMTALATGLAIEGFIVFTYSIGNFPTFRCLEQIRNDACYHNANVKIVSIGGGFSYGALGPSHHATEDLTVMRALPGMTVVSPGDLFEAAEATEAVARLKGPCFLRLDKSAGSLDLTSNREFMLGKIRVVREGTDLTFVATGGILGEVQKAAEVLAAQGVCCRILSVHTIKPLDTEAIVLAAKETGGIVTVEEHTIHGGLGGVVAETLLDAGVQPGFFKRLALGGGFSSIVGSQSYLREMYGLDEKALVAAAGEMSS